MYQVINLGSTLDDGAAGGCPVDCRMRPDFHVVANNDVADLRHFMVLAANGDKTKTVAADGGVAMNNTAIADNALLPYGYTGVNDDVSTDLDALADIGVRIDDGVIADYRIIRDNDIGHYRDIRSDFNPLADDGCGMHAALHTRRRREYFEQFSKGQPGISYPDGRFIKFGDGVRNDDRPGLGRTGFVEVRRHGEGNLLGTGGLNVGDTGNNNIRIAEHCATNQLGDFS